MRAIQLPSDPPSPAAPLSGKLLRAATARRPNPRGFPNVALVTHGGEQVKFYDDVLKGKVVVISFMYTNCDGKCPGITANGHHRRS